MKYMYCRLTELFLQDIQGCTSNEELEELNVLARGSLKHLKVKIEVSFAKLIIYLLLYFLKILFLTINNIEVSFAHWLQKVSSFCELNA